MRACYSHFPATDLWFDWLKETQTIFDASTYSRIADAVKVGVKVLACENTMRNQKLSKDDMHPAMVLKLAEGTPLSALAPFC